METSNNPSINSAVFYLKTIWRNIVNSLFTSKDENTGLYELIGTSYSFSPCSHHVMSSKKSIFDPEKAAIMYFWYKIGDRKDNLITKYFEEYKHCIDENHREFNSNYGYYAYTQKGLETCWRRLIEDEFTRQACFCINNNEAMSDNSIDKLCTNAIHFFIRHNKLEMVVQMRSSNFFTLLPYDAFMFTVFYQHVYSELRIRKYTGLMVGNITMQVASLHAYEDDVQRCGAMSKEENCIINGVLIENFSSLNWIMELERKLINILIDGRQKRENSQLQQSNAMDKGFECGEENSR